MPWLGFFDQMKRADVFVYYDDVQFDKNGWRNRNRVKAPDGTAHWLTVPVRTKGLESKRIMDIPIDTRAPWAKKQIGTLKQFYAKAPHAGEYLPQLEEILMKPWEMLIDLDIELVKQFCVWLGLKPNIKRSSELKIGGEKSGRLLALCKHFGASRYLSGDSAKDYLDMDLFKKEGVEVEWQQYKHPVYPQLHGEFIPYLSVIDLLLNAGGRSGEMI